MLTEQNQCKVHCDGFICFGKQLWQEKSHHQLKSTTFIMPLHKSYLGHLHTNPIINNKWPGLVSEEGVLMLITAVAAWKLIYKTLILPPLRVQKVEVESEANLQTKHGRCSGSTVRCHNTFIALQRYPWARCWTLKCSYRELWWTGIQRWTCLHTLCPLPRPWKGLSGQEDGMRRVNTGHITESQETLDPPLEPIQVWSIKRFVQNHIWLVS